MTLRTRAPRAGQRWLGLAAVVSIMTLLVATIVMAAHPTVSLTDSDFEIDTDANLKVDHASPSLDWANVDEDRQTDEPSGTGDDSFGQGSKEDTAVPVVVSGSIPPNKSDLKDFGVYVEENENGKFLHLFWTRVQDPSGTTNMDFEFNKSTTASANGVTPVRTSGDLLITYDLSKGGTVPVLSLREWDGSAWGTATDLSATGAATGAINTSLIPSGDSDQLGALDPRTFGEASIDLDFIFDPDACESFGSAYLKSRSSDSFTAALKDFIAPLPVNISNCGSVIIRKQTDPDEADNSTQFGFTSNLVTDPDDPTAVDFDLADDGAKTILNVVAGTGYSVTEDDPSGLGYELTDIDCGTASVTEDLAARSVTFDLAVGQTVDCTFTNTAHPKLKLVKSVDNNDGGTAVADDWTLSAMAAAPDDGRNFSDAGGSGEFEIVYAGVDYVLSESSLTGYSSTGVWSCDGGTFTSPDTISLSNGDEVTCTITNTDDTPQLKLVKIAVNDNGGSATEDSWTLSANAASPNSGRNFSNAGGSGVLTDVYAGAEYTLSESVVAGYSTDGVWSCDGGAMNGDDKITLALGDQVTCTITNDDDKFQPEGTTIMSWILHDSATFGIRAGALNAADADITFRLYSDDACSIQVGIDETLDVALNGAGDEASASTSTGVAVTLADTYYWRAFYTGDQFNSSASTECGSEVTTISDDSPAS